MRETNFWECAINPTHAPPDGMEGPKGTPLANRFDVYRNNIAASLTQALGEAFPAVKTYLGEPFFSQMAAIFWRQYPPKTPILSLWGEDLPTFLTTFQPTQKLPWLADLARFEIALRTCYHAPDCQIRIGITFNDIGLLLSSKILFTPSTHLLRSKWPVASLWEKAMKDPTTTIPPSGQNILLTRPEYDPVWLVLPQGGGLFMEHLISGHTLQAALDTTLENIPTFTPVPLFSFFQNTQAIQSIEKA